MKPSILIIHASGTNRDQEAAWACEMAGGRPEIIHMNQLRAGERKMADYQMLLLPGGFSYGDALGAGSRMALDMEVYFQDELNEFIAEGRPVLGICNGFQVLVKAGLLPGWEAAEGDRHFSSSEEKNGQTNQPHASVTVTSGDQNRKSRSAEVAPRTVTLTENKNGRFECRWVHLAVDPKCTAPALRALDDMIFCPVAHGEGNLQATPEALTRMEANGLVALRYVNAQGEPANGAYPLNPNGSLNDIAGICNAKGNVIGLMPHPEDHIVAPQNPLGRTDHLGLKLFESMVKYS